MRYLLATLRFTLFVGMTFGIYSIWLAGSFFIPNKQYWRQLIFRKWSVFFAGILGMNIEVIGEPPRAPFFLVANHLSYVDIPALRAVVDGVFVAKGEIGGWFMAGKMVRDMGMIYVDRGRKRDIPRAGAEIIQRLDEGEGVIVFPEGMTTRGESVSPFNSSFLEFAANTDLPVSYASITYRMDPIEGRASDMVCWWDDSTFVTHLLRLFMARGFTTIVNFGEQTVSNPDRKELARELTERVREKFIPVI